MELCPINRRGSGFLIPCIFISKRVCVNCSKVLCMGFWATTGSLISLYRPTSLKVLLLMVRRRTVMPTLTTCTLKTTQRERQLFLIPLTSLSLAGCDVLCMTVWWNSFYYVTRIHFSQDVCSSIHPSVTRPYSVETVTYVTYISSNFFIVR